jgi:hypothetical protein
MFYMGMTLKPGCDSEPKREAIAGYFAKLGFSGFFKTDRRDVVAGPRRMIVVTGTKESIIEAKKNLKMSVYELDVDVDFAQMIISERTR